MSLILDALKKLEQEKAGRRTKVADLGPAIVAASATESRPAWKLAAVVVVAIAASVGATVAVMKLAAPSGDRGPVTVVAPQETPALPPAKDSTPLPAQTQDLPASPQPAPPQHRPAAPPLPSTPAPPAREVSPVTAPDLNVSGIAWQDDRISRRAVVNGILVGEGSTVAGATVREIQADRVVFSVNGRNLEIRNSSPLQ